MQARAQLVGRQLGPGSPLTLAVHDDTGGASTATTPATPRSLAHLTITYVMASMAASMTLRDAVASAATGDVWLFRGRSVADHRDPDVHEQPSQPRRHGPRHRRSPTADVAREAERCLVNVWTGERARGVQLHRLDHAVSVERTIRPAPWLRLIDIDVTTKENAALSVDAIRRAGFPEHEDARPTLARPAFAAGCR